jgi:predicted oxidoreductase
MVIGDLGTYAGIRTDAHARALDADGNVIAGLYAAGNDMAVSLRRGPPCLVGLSDV